MRATLLIPFVTQGQIYFSRDKFLTVTEDCMLLGVGVITVAAIILNISSWEQVSKC